MNRDICNSKVTFVVGDIHFDLHHKEGWEAFVQCVKDSEPDQIVINGDFIDLGMLSRYRQGEDDPLNAIEQVKCLVREVQRLVPFTKRLVVIEGNHDERWGKVMHNVPATALKGAVGLSLKEQCYAQGLPKEVVWISESNSSRGYQVGKFLVRHGHKQGSKTSPQNIASQRINKSNGQSEIVGHHHKAQLFCRTAGGVIATAIAAPCLTMDHDYAVDADWQRGFVVIEQYDRIDTAYPIVMNNRGSFCWAGRAYDGPKLLKRRNRSR
jgi:predicted phosphodiesterase